MKRAFALGLMLMFIGTGLTAVAQNKNAEKAKEALQELSEFIGEWNSACGNVSTSAAVKGFWKEKFEWGWRFKGDDAWMAVKFTDSKILKGGELKYDVPSKKYVLTLTDIKDKSHTYKGDLKRGKLDLDGLNPETKENIRVSLTTAAEGVRFLYYIDRKPEGGTLWTKDYKGEANKVGESLGKAEKKNLCVVTFGLGTSTVSHAGKSYFVCCSGCRDAFMENPEKYIKEFEKKMKMK